MKDNGTLVPKSGTAHIRKDVAYAYGRYYITHGVGSACMVTRTIVLDSMCGDPNKTVAVPIKSEEKVVAFAPAPAGNASSSSNKKKKKIKKKIKLKDPCWLTIQGDTQVNLDHWEWEASQRAIRNGGRRGSDASTLRKLKVSNQADKTKTSKTSTESSDIFVPTGLSTTCASTDIITTKRGRGGLPLPICQSKEVTATLKTTVLDGGGTKQLFHITTGAKLSLRNLILR